MCISARTFAEDLTTEKVVRPIVSSYMAEWGASHLTDTYLSPLKYSGWHTAMRYERLQAMRFNPDLWVMRLSAGIDIDRTTNPNRNSTMTGASISGQWSMARRWRIGHGLSVGAGGMTGLDLGGLFNSRNGNNPASANASWQIGVTAYTTWNGKIGHLPITFRYNTSLPVTGVFFAPDYGELYYEIWLGDTSGLIHPIWWGNWTRWDNLVTVDLHLGGTSLRLGYSGRISTWRVNNITSRTFLHSIVIGITTEWISLRPGRSVSGAARSISALY